MAMRSFARKSELEGAQITGARPASAAFWTARSRSVSSTAEAAPATSAPRRGAVAHAGRGEPGRFTFGAWHLANCPRMLAVSRQSVRNVFLQHHMEIGATE